MNKPKVIFLPVNMSLFWELYPELKQQTIVLKDKVKRQLDKYYNVIEYPLIGSRQEAEEFVIKGISEDVDCFLVWENGYVSSEIPLPIIEAMKGIPCALLVTQRDKMIPTDMDYQRYMDSTAVTSVMELGGVLSRKGLRYKSFIGHIDDTAIYCNLEEYVRAAHAKRALKNLHVGMVGYAYPGMLDICVDDAGVAELGASVERITLMEVSKELENIDPGDVENFIKHVKAECDDSRISNDDLNKAARLYISLKNIISRKELKALCVNDYECLSFISKTVSDFALGYLENQMGIATGVEGDMPNCIGAFILRVFSNNSTMFVDWTMFDDSSNAIFLQHNGKADPQIVTKPILSPSAEPFGGVEGNGVVFEAVGKPGLVTMLSLTYRKEGWVMFAAEGNSIEMEPRPCRLNQMLVQVDKPIRTFLQCICDFGIGHHLNVGYGHFLNEAKLLAEMLGIKFFTCND
jgi:L-arabinose isomerase